MLVAAACTGTPPGAHPEDMSAKEHLKRARAEERKAEALEARYDPWATAWLVPVEPVNTFTYEDETYNPTEQYLVAAHKHREHAEAHLEAAAELALSEAEECGEIPPEARGACPLLGQVGEVENVEDGVRITVADGVEREAVLAHMRCHLAHAAKLGFEGPELCPLYVKGLSIEEDGDTILLTAEDPETVRLVQEKVAEEVE